ncbi:AAA family ATPase [Chitinophaga sp.]|uniref:AbiJ-related protein n=1 Tax=Chitinophaga sp. TaxID=1869181 RepID=UPI0031DB3B7D
MLSKQLKTSLFRKLDSIQGAYGNDIDERGLLRFISDIWDVKSMPSTDHRKKTLYDDIIQHTVANNDWEDDYLFIDILNLVDGSEEKFLLYLETIVHPNYKNNLEQIQKFVFIINAHIEREGLKLIVLDYDNGLQLPIFKVRPIEMYGDLPTGLKVNKIPFYIIKEPKYRRSDRLSSHDKPSTLPSFVLVFNPGWNDFGYFTDFSLYFHGENNSYSIGPVKIMSIGQPYKVIDVFSEDVFYVLGDSFCSLGQTEEYYERLKNLFDVDLESILYALKDAAFFPLIHEKVEKEYVFSQSLIRNDDAERLLREIKYKLYDYDPGSMYKFKYLFTPIYGDNSITVDFDFNSETIFPSRIYAIIGKNGTGKTQLISSIPRKFSEKLYDQFIPRIPLFGKIIAVSYSAFDRFEIPTASADFSYVYCGLRNKSGERLTEDELLSRFQTSITRIESLDRIEKLRSIILNFIEDSIAIEMFSIDKKASKPTYLFDLNGFFQNKAKLSSGQAILIYVISEIVANIRFDSLLLYDEPETHLHPNAISELVNTIYELVDEFQSYCIIATHSPLIVREIPSKNVYVLEKHENVASLRKIGKESFGENLTIITDEIFGSKEVPKQYKKIIDNLVGQKMNFEDILNILESDNIPLSLNARMYIKSKLSELNA